MARVPTVVTYNRRCSVRVTAFQAVLLARLASHTSRWRGSRQFCCMHKYCKAVLATHMVPYHMLQCHWKLASNAHARK